MKPPSSLLLLAVALATTGTSPGLADDAGPARQDHAALGGGPTASSPDYAHVGDFVGLGGAIASEAGTVLRPGFLGQLNDPPRVEPDLLRRPPGLGAKLPVAKLTENDSDPEGGAVRLLAFLATAGTHGTLSADDGWLLYAPPPGLSAPDRFHYVVEDAEGDRSVGTVAVEIGTLNPVRGLNLLRITPHPTGGVELVLVGLPNRWYRIEASSDAGVTEWQWVDRRQSTTTGLLVIRDSAATGTRFYRTVAELVE